jgi:hypothetical protein
VLEERVSMLVSSKHVSLASPVFKAMLQHKFIEGESLRKDGKVDVPLPDDEPMAFAILMKIVHAQNDTVPTEVDLPTLINIAILVDKYRLHACVSAFTSLWITLLKPLIPQSCLNKDLLSWLCITWVFRKDVEFNMVTSVAQKYHAGTSYRSVYGPAAFDSLPIPAKVICKITLIILDMIPANFSTASIDEKREKAMHEAFSELEALVNGLQGRQQGFGPLPLRRCPKGDEDCEAMLLGSLLRSATSQGIWPIRATLCSFISATELVRRLRALTVRSQCGRGLLQSAEAAVDAKHGVNGVIAIAILRLESSYQGLNLKDFE